MKYSFSVYQNNYVVDVQGNLATVYRDGETTPLFTCDINSPTSSPIIEVAGDEFQIKLNDIKATGKNVQKHFFGTFKKQKNLKKGANSEQSGEITSPMTGKIQAVPVVQGQKVNKGDLLVVLEAMKMEYKLIAPMNAIVEELKATVGLQVERHQLLVSLKMEK